jgi:hypothetical protein
MSEIAMKNAGTTNAARPGNIARPLAIALLLAALAPLAGAREPELLSEKEYALEREEVVVRAQRPQWHGREEAPRWDRRKIELDIEASQPRLRALPKYEREERDDAMQVRDRMNAEPRIKLFDFKF